MKRQSNDRWLTRLVERSSPTSLFGRFVSTCMARSLSASDRAKTTAFPAAFRAWIVFRVIVDVVLPNDVCAFAMAFLRCGGFLRPLDVVLHERFGFDAPSVVPNVTAPVSTRTFEHMTASEILFAPYVAYPVAIALILFAFVSKKKSHDVIGSYSWYWGDFFFTLKRDLIFEGIFEMIPHPMYSVGYSWYYGFALISGSYVVFGLALFSHLMQMIFLVTVETPHIDKVYGAPPNLADRSKSNIMLFRHFDIFRSSDFSLALIVGLTVVVFAMGIDWNPLERTCGGSPDNHGRPCLTDAWTWKGKTYENVCTVDEYSEWWCFTAGDPSVLPGNDDGTWGLCNCGRVGAKVVVLHVVLWRVLKTFITAFVLKRQAACRWWSSKFDGDDRTAFESWKNLSNLMSTMCGVSFLIAAYYLYEPLDGSTQGQLLQWTPDEIFCILLGSMLIWLNHWSNCEVEAAIGEYGWFYGDYFFQQPPSGLTGVDGLSYSGIYKFVNNPDALFGFAGFYGIALLCHSWTLGVLGVMAQLMNLALVHLVEIPHAEEMYKSRFRKLNPTMRRVKETTRKIHRGATKLRVRAESMSESLVEAFKDVAARTVSPTSSPKVGARTTDADATPRRRSSRRR